MSANAMQLNLHAMTTLDNAYQIAYPNNGPDGAKILRLLIIIKLFDSSNNQVGLTRGHPFTANLSVDDGVANTVIYTSDFTGGSTDQVINLIDFAIPVHTEAGYNGVELATAATVEKIEVSFYHTIKAANEFGLISQSVLFDLKFETA